MNVQVKHNGTAITGFVKSYHREHKICTGIGTLGVEIIRTIQRTFVPWDSIDIWENGSFKVRYYVSSVTDSEPTGLLTLDCQDISKRLVDYFIPDSYTVDYPSYTRYWIEKFLTEAGVDFQFTTSSQGNLLSNFTQLGLTTAYEQLQTLLQMSGWFMYFSGDEKAVIGSLDINTVTGSYNVGKTDILNILKTSDDKMLRNRALILGAYDPQRGGYASADVTVHTPWNYDNRDIRSVIISNSNISNRATAYGMANQIIKEFARITVEKHIQIWGARNFSLGRAMRVSSNVWRGRGLITTFGVEMGKDGLITNVVLDERCPRLFGYFDWGDYVYVGTYGDGVWRKHIRFDHTWHNFSTGLTNLEIVDLHINNGVFGSVGSSGQMYYAIDDLPWYQLPFSGLSSSLDNTAASGGATMVGFSGLMARAVIVDKLGNVVRYGVDTSSGINYGDYFMNASGWFRNTSGVFGSGARGWIVEYDVLNSNAMTASYPISVSGEYNFLVMDLENDGKNDYVSVATVGSGGSSIPFSNGGYNFGYKTSNPPYITHDHTISTSYNFDSDLSLEGQSALQGFTTSSVAAVGVFENESAGEREFVYWDGGSGIRRLKRISVTKPFDPLLGRERVTFTLNQSPQAAASITDIAVYKVSSNLYRVFHQTTVSNTNDFTISIFYKQWDIAGNTLSADTLCAAMVVPKDTVKGTRFSFSLGFRTIDGIIYAYGHALGTAAATGSDNTNYVKIYGMQVPLSSASATVNGLIHTQNYTSQGGGVSWNIAALGSAGIRQNGSSIYYLVGVREWNNTFAASATQLNNYLLATKNAVSFSNTLIQSATSSTAPGFLLVNDGSGEDSAGYNQTTDTEVIWYLRRAANNVTYKFNGDTIVVGGETSVPYYWKDSNIYPLFGNTDHYYVAKNGSDWHFCSAQTIIPVSQLAGLPSNFSVVKPINTANLHSGSYFWIVQDTNLLKQVIMRSSTTGQIGTTIIPFVFMSMTGSRAFMAGNFVVDSSGRVMYLDNTDPGGGDSLRFLLLRRDGTEFTVIEEEEYQMRVDISNYAPALTVGSGESTFVSNFVYETELLVIESTTPSGRIVEDYRYTFLEPTSDGIVSSGVAGLQTILYISGSGIYGADALTYSGGFSPVWQVPSGWGKRIETSNHTPGGQYVFITTSGFVQTFYQKDPLSAGFIPYSGMPQSRATIIRLDDAI